MSPRAQAITLFFVYSLTIVSTLWLSGRIAGRATLYDEYMVSLDGNVLQVRDFEAAKRFYSDVLDFRFLEGEDRDHTLVLPGDRHIFLYHRISTVADDRGMRSQPSNFILLRVRNGLKKLQREIAARSGTAAVAISQKNVADGVNILPPGRVSETVETDAGQEFIVKDPDGNLFIFYQPFPFQGARFRPLIAVQNR